MLIIGKAIEENKIKVDGVYVDGTQVTTVESSEIPTPENIQGKEAELYLNPQTGELYYEYKQRELTNEEEIDQLKGQLQSAEADNLTTLEALAEVYEMLLALQA